MSMYNTADSKIHINANKRRRWRVTTKSPKSAQNADSAQITDQTNSYERSIGRQTNPTDKKSG